MIQLKYSYFSRYHAIKEKQQKYLDQLSEVEKLLDQAHITANKNTIPNEQEKATVASGIRIGSPAMTTRGLKEKEFKKIGVFKTNIEEIKQLPKGYFVSYNNSYKVKKDTKIAVIPVGYMDGFNKNKLRDDFSLKNNIISVGMEIKKIFKDNSLKAIINGKKYKIIGKLGMYHGIIDITNENDIQVGDEVILDISPLQTNEKIRREYI